MPTAPVTEKLLGSRRPHRKGRDWRRQTQEGSLGFRWPVAPPRTKVLPTNRFSSPETAPFWATPSTAEKALPPWSQDKPKALATTARHFPEAQGQRPERLQRACPMTDVVGLQRGHHQPGSHPASASRRPESVTPTSAAAPEHGIPARESWACHCLRATMAGGAERESCVRRHAPGRAEQPLAMVPRARKAASAAAGTAAGTGSCEHDTCSA